METWQATIKEKGSDSLLKPQYLLSNMFDQIADESLREIEIRNYLCGFWGLGNSDVEWYKLERIE